MTFVKFIAVFLCLSTFCLAETKSAEEKSVPKEISGTIKEEDKIIENKDEQLLSTQEKKEQDLEKKNIIAKKEEQEEKLSF